MSYKTINLELGMPSTLSALRQMNQEILTARASGTTTLKFIHGYGSSGKGGAIRTALREELANRKRSGQIKDFITGEDFSAFDPRARQLLQALPTVSSDPDLGRCNHGVTIVIV